MLDCFGGSRIEVVQRFQGRWLHLLLGKSRKVQEGSDRTKCIAPRTLHQHKKYINGCFSDRIHQGQTNFFLTSSKRLKLKAWPLAACQLTLPTFPPFSAFHRSAASKVPRSCWIPCKPSVSRHRILDESRRVFP